MKVLAVERILQQLDHVVAYGILRREAFRPCEKDTRIECFLFDGETEGKSEAEFFFVGDVIVSTC